MNHDKYLRTKMHKAGANLILICDKTRKLVDEWLELCNYYHFIDDSISINDNLKEFIEHRHYQSIYCLLTKNIIYTVIFNLEKYCIKCIRNRSGLTKIYSY